MRLKIPDYPRIILRPMDVGTVLKKLRRCDATCGGHAGAARDAARRAAQRGAGLTRRPLARPASQHAARLRQPRAGHAGRAAHLGQLPAVRAGGAGAAARRRLARAPRRRGDADPAAAAAAPRARPTDRSYNGAQHPVTAAANTCSEVFEKVRVTRARARVLTEAAPAAPGPPSCARLDACAPAAPPNLAMQLRNRALNTQAWAQSNIEHRWQVEQMREEREEQVRRCCRRPARRRTPPATARLPRALHRALTPLAVSPAAAAPAQPGARPSRSAAAPRRAPATTTLSRR